MNQKDLKLTDLDYATASHHLQMLKAAVPYMEISQQKIMALFIKWSELRRTAAFFEDNEDGMLNVCSLDENHISATDMLAAMKPHANQKEQDFIDLLSGIISHKATASNSKSPIAPEQFLAFLPPEQQAKLETLQIMMQTLNQ